MTKSDLLNNLFEKYNLVFDQRNPDSRENDVFIHKHYKLITRGGIQKIERGAKIKCDFEVVAAGPDYVILKGTGTAPGGETYTTFASANPGNCKTDYYAEMAEKRCRSRLVLTLAGLYETGEVFGQDEFDNGEDNVKRAKYRGS